MPRIVSFAGLALATSLIVAACSSGSASIAPGTPASPMASAVPTTAASAIASAAASPAAAARINANTASQEELAAAFDAAGISNAAKWAREVAEYRPYPADPTWAQLRQELAKYNIDPTVLEQIIALLEV